MTIVLCIAGICAVLAGVLAIAFGIPVHEFSFGNTLILAGGIAVCSGMLVLAQAAVVRELKNIARRIAPRSPEARQTMASPVAPPAELAEELPSAAVLRSWGRDRTRPDPPLSAEVAPSRQLRRRHLMFSSTLRKGHDLAVQPATLGAPRDHTGAPAIDDGEAEDAWQRSDRLRESEQQQGRTGAGERPQPGRGEDQAPATVIKSGVVEGMLYSLYSDGSIEAKMPEGLMRFATLDELRAHLDRPL